MKQQVIRTIVFIIIGTLCVFGILLQKSDSLKVEPVEAQTQEVVIEEEPSKQEEITEKLFFFDRINEVDIDPVDAILFDALIKNLKANISREISPQEIEKLMIVYNYMLEQKPERDKKTLIELAYHAIKYANKYSVPLGLVVGVMQTESNFNPNAESSAKAAGPMQVMWNVHGDLLKANGITQRDQLFTTDLGVAAGCLILSRYLRDEQSVAGGLKRYYGALSGNYLSLTYSNWHTFELYSSGILEGSPKNALARDRSYLTRVMSGQSSTKKKENSSSKEGTIVIKKSNGGTIVWRSK